MSLWLLQLSSSGVRGHGQCAFVHLPVRVLLPCPIAVNMHCLTLQASGCRGGLRAIEKTSFWVQSSQRGLCEQRCSQEAAWQCLACIYESLDHCSAALRLVGEGFAGRGCGMPFNINVVLHCKGHPPQCPSVRCGLLLQSPAASQSSCPLWGEGPMALKAEQACPRSAAAQGVLHMLWRHTCTAPLEFPWGSRREMPHLLSTAMPLPSRPQKVKCDRHCRPLAGLPGPGRP